ncbi:MAG: hypothetical protein ACR2JE_10150, partial [Acidobacteriaceae bacterium]
MRQTRFSPRLTASAIAAALVFSAAGVLEAQQSTSQPTFPAQQQTQPQAQSQPQPQQGSQKTPTESSHQDLDKGPPPAVQGTPTNGAPQPGPNGVMPGVKPGSAADVNAVGTRDIGGRG